MYGVHPAIVGVMLVPAPGQVAASPGHFSNL